MITVFYSLKVFMIYIKTLTIFPVLCDSVDTVILIVKCIHNLRNKVKLMH